MNPMEQDRTGMCNPLAISGLEINFQHGGGVFGKHDFSVFL